MNVTDNQTIFTEHRNFWDSLQMDILTSNMKPEAEDYRVCIERSFMFSMFFRGCLPFETVGFQRALDLKDYGYLILMDFSEGNRSNGAEFIPDQFELHQFINKNLHNKHSAVGPYITNRISILVTQDSDSPDQTYKEDSIILCRELIQKLEAHFHVKLIASIGSLHNIHSIFSSFIDALVGLYHNTSDQIIFSPEIKRIETREHFDYLLAEKHLLEAVRLRKLETFDYFSMIMENIKTFNDAVKRNKIMEILILTNHAMNQDTEGGQKAIDYTGWTDDMKKLSGSQLIDYAYQLFIYITSYVKPQNSIDYTNHIVKATKEYLESHYTDDISLEDMAEQVNISPQYLSKLIKKTTGFNFIDWLSMLRVKKAKELLTNSDLTVKEVCFLVGYKDPNYFSRIFKKRIGITPSEFVTANSFLSNKS